MELNNVHVIEIGWEGPFTMDEIKQFTNDIDFGLYLAFGPHKIYGDNVLLYVGKAEQQTLGVRILQHLKEDWYGSEQIYIGRLGGAKIPNMSDWDQSIDYAETKLIQYCLPAWNASKFNSRTEKSFGDAVIINNGLRIKAIPTVLADWLYEKSSFRLNTWKAYSNRTAN